MNANSSMETYCGHVRSPADAIKLFEACRLGLLPRVQRRLSEKERQSIKSGSVFVWDEREAGMRRWTDGKSWSASRVSGSFLTYREMEGKRGGGTFVPAPARQRVAGKTPDSGRGSDEDAEMDGDGVDGYRYKPDGLMKQSFSITTSTGQHLHLISYYSRHHANSHELLQPTLDPELRHLTAIKGMYPESTVQEQAQGPAVTRAPMQGAYASPSQMTPGPPQHRGPYPYGIQPGYNWPPSPMSTPPYNYSIGPYGQLQAQPSSAHTSPHQGTQVIPPYDRQALSPQDANIPPPPNQRMSLSGAPPQQLSMYSPNLSPLLAQRLLAEQQARQATKLAMEHQRQRLHQQQHQQQEQLRRQQMMHSPRVGPHIASIVPQPTPPTQPPSQPASSTSPSDPGSQANGSSSSTASPAPSQSQSQNIPSISSMVHNHTPNSTNPTPAPDPVAAEDPRTATPSSVTSNGTKSRGESASPKAGKAKGGGEGGPQDIPHAKLGFGGEDLRALRVLDRKFCI